eukprot:403362801
MEQGQIEVRKLSDHAILALYEFIGTAILTIALNFAWGQADVIASGIFVAIVLTYKITGSHLNAGISLGIYIINNEWKKQAPILATYILAQIFGAYFGMIFSYLVIGHTDSLNLRPPLVEYKVWYVFLTELFFSWIFQTVYLHAKTNKIAPSTDPGLRAITMMVVQYVNAGMIINITGGCLNPSIGFCAVTFRAMVRKAGEESFIRYLPAYFFGPLIAGLLAGLFVRFIALVVTASPDQEQKPQNEYTPTNNRQINDSRSTAGLDFFSNKQAQ